MINVSNSEADIYRKAFAKNKFYKKKEFRDKLEIRNPRLSVDDVELIMDRLESLQSYSSCKSHAYSYAYLLYILTYHKYYNPKQFWESTLKNCCTSYRKWTHYREAYCNNVDLNKINPSQIMNRSPLIAHEADNLQVAHDRMKESMVQCLVVKNDLGIIAGVIQIFK